MSNSKETLSPQPYAQGYKLFPIRLSIEKIRNSIPCYSLSCVLADAVRRVLINQVEKPDRAVLVGWGGNLVDFRGGLFPYQFTDRNLAQKIIEDFDSLVLPISWEAAINFWAKYRDKPLHLRVPVELLK